MMVIFMAESGSTQTVLICVYLVVVIPTPLKNDGVKVSWGDDIPNMMGTINQIFQTTNQQIMNIDFI